MKSIDRLFSSLFGKKAGGAEPVAPGPVPTTTPADSTTPDYSEFADDPLIQRLDKAIEDGKRMQAAMVGGVTADEATSILNGLAQQMAQVSAAIQIDVAESDKAAGYITQEEYETRINNQLDRYNRPPSF